MDPGQKGLRNSIQDNEPMNTHEKKQEGAYSSRTMKETKWKVKRLEKVFKKGEVRSWVMKYFVNKVSIIENNKKKRLIDNNNVQPYYQ